MSLQHTGGEYVTAIGKVVPAIAVTSATVAGMALQDWVLIATLVYTVLQTILLIRNFFKGKRDGSE